MKRTLLSLAIASMCVGAQAATPSMEQMWEMIQAQKAEIERLKTQLNQTDQRLETTEVKVEATADAVESGAGGNESIAKLAEWASKTKIGGYGEVLYNDGTQTSDSSTSNPNKEIDVQRFVLYFGHQFTDDLRFFSEIEYEHTNTGGAGVVELEQAYIEWDYAEDHSVLAGLHLPPLGILNETHEPETFYGVERNRVESRIIPTTYRVIGVKLAGKISDGWSYDVALHEGLQLEFDDSSADGGDLDIRSSRQNGSRSNAEELAATARIKYTGIPGLEWAFAVQYQSDLTQDGIANSRLGRDAVTGVNDIDAVLWETHIAYQSGPFGFRALYAHWDIDDDIELLGTDGIGRDKQFGWYVEPSYKVTEKLGVFARYENVDETDGASGGIEERRTLVGLNYWLNPNVVLKADIQFEDDIGRSSSSELDGFNLGLGWSF